jgi:hypothetical protein
MTPTQAPTNTPIRRQQGGLDLSTFEEVTLVKVGTFVPVTTLEEAKTRVGGDTDKFLSIINEGLEAEAGRAMKDNSTIPWQIEDEEGNLTPFSGMLADAKTVGGLVLNMAKSIFGYSKDSTPEARKAAKQAAKDLIRGNETMKAGLIKNAVSQ